MRAALHCPPLRTLMTVPRIHNHPGSTRIGLRVASGHTGTEDTTPCPGHRAQPQCQAAYCRSCRSCRNARERPCTCKCMQPALAQHAATCSQGHTPHASSLERVCTGNTGGRPATTVAVATAATITAATAAAATAAVHGGGVEAETSHRRPTPPTQPLPPRLIDRVTASAAERPAVARVAAAVVRLTTGCVAAHHKTTRLAVAGEEEEQLQTQNQNPTQTLQPAHPQLRARAAEEQWVMRGLRPPRIGHCGEGVEEGARRTHRPRICHQTSFRPRDVHGLLQGGRRRRRRSLRRRNRLHGPRGRRCWRSAASDAAIARAQLGSRRHQRAAHGNRFVRDGYTRLLQCTRTAISSVLTRDAATRDPAAPRKHHQRSPSP